MSSTCEDGEMANEDEEYVPAWQMNNPVIHQPPFEAIRLEEDIDDEGFSLRQDGEHILIRDSDALVALRDAIDEKIEEVENRE